MSVAKVTELISASPVSFEDALKKGIDRACATLEQVTGVWVEGQKAVIDNGKVKEYRVILKVTFVLKG